MLKRISACALAMGLLASAAFAGEPQLDRSVALETRWWGPHEFGWRVAEAVGLRWAITDGISGRARVGGSNVPASKLTGEFARQTGIKAEVIGGLLVLHRPDAKQRKELEAKLAGGGEAAVRAAWLLGWLKDARAWPALARAAAGKDVATALAAAHALRRLDGEEPIDLRRWVLPYWTVYRKSQPEQGLWQRPLGECFKDSVSRAQLDALSKSLWIPLRETAARLAPGCGATGKSVVDKLTKDPSLTVRQAARRALRAWQTPVKGKAGGHAIKPPDMAAMWKLLDSNSESPARKSTRWIATFGTEADIARLVKAGNATKNGHVRNAVWSALAAGAGGKPAIEAFRKIAAQGRPWPADNHTWGRSVSIALGKYALAMILDGQKLADELGPRLGTENWALSSEFLLARYAGPPAFPHLKKVLKLRGHAAPLAVGYIGGPEAVKMLTPVLASDSLSAAAAAARGLGESGLKAAIPPLVKALSSSHRVVRSRAALALGRIGGPEAARALAGLVGSEKEYLPRRSACAMLKEIGVKEHAALVAKSEKELADFVPVYRPINPKFGAAFPTGKWVGLGRTHSVASVGETRVGVDAHSGLALRYGGCSGCYSNECVAYDPGSGKWVVIRPPENLGLFFNETRAAQGCSRGLAFDPKSRCFWINHAVGGNGQPSNGWMMPGRSTCKYDLALDRFEGNFPGSGKRGGEGPTWFVADSRRGIVYNEIMGPTCAVIDTATKKLISVKFTGAPNLPHIYLHDPAAYDPVSGAVVRSVTRANKYKKNPQALGVWLFDALKGTCRKSKAKLPAGKFGGGNSMAYDSLNRAVILFLSTGAWRYDREKDEWVKIADGNCEVYTVGYDPQHNVFLGVRKWGSWGAFRFKNVPAGTKAYYGPEKGASK